MLVFILFRVVLKRSRSKLDSVLLINIVYVLANFVSDCLMASNRTDNYNKGFVKYFVSEITSKRNSARQVSIHIAIVQPPSDLM